MDIDPYFGFQVPLEAPGVPSQVLNPRATWNDPKAYDNQATKLARMFQENFEQFREGTPAEVIAAGPHADGKARVAAGVS